MTKYDSNSTLTEDERYGELVFEFSAWDTSEVFSQNKEEIPTHYCTDEELGLTLGPKTLVYPIKESMQEEVETFKKKFKCADNPQRDLELWGDFDSRKT